MKITSMYTYPVKGLTGQPVVSAHLTSVEGFPFDRYAAITDGKWTFGGDSHKPKNKIDYTGLMANPRIATIKLQGFDPAGTMQVHGADGRGLSVDLNDPASRERLVDFLIDYLGLPASPRPQVVCGAKNQFSDMGMMNTRGLHQCISLVNLASVRDLAERLGLDALDPLRFRANLYFDSSEPWEELDWVGRCVRIGGVLFRVIMVTPRCVIPAVNPATGEKDVGIVQGLMKHLGHKNLGVYVDVIEGGEVRVEDGIKLVDGPPDSHELIAVPLNGVKYAMFARRMTAAMSDQASGAGA